MPPATMTPAFTVLPYSIEQLIELCVKNSRATKDDISEKIHKVYFDDYFKALGAKTIVVEYEYVDRDYLEDYISYYVKCHQDYGRHCTRLHFFDIAFTHDQFREVLNGKTELLTKDRKDAYLGFIVIKPLPKTVFGRTCLKTYPTEGRRYFPVCRKYEVSLFGINMSVDTLAYQEQDHVAAACATSTLWTIFQRTGVDYHHLIPTPIEITTSATSNLPNQQRNLPNNGLSIEQMAHAIRHVGLEPYSVRVEDIYLLKSNIYAYLRAGIPIAMGLRMIDASYSPYSEMEPESAHAIAVTGFSLGKSKPDPVGYTEFLTSASRIDKLYVHDDQVGPFARMIIEDGTISYEDKNRAMKTGAALSTSWKGTNNQIGSVKAIPLAIIFPLYHKIRIPLKIIEESVIKFDSIIEQLRKKGFLTQLPEQLEWDIHLCTLNNFKSSILHHPGIADKHREEVLIEKLPRFLWRAIAASANMKRLELLFDATDIEQGDFFLRAIKYDLKFFSQLQSFPNLATSIDSKESCYSVIEWILKSPK